jgi:hypothetical protein
MLQSRLNLHAYAEGKSSTAFSMHEDIGRHTLVLYDTSVISTE